MVANFRNQVLVRALLEDCSGINPNRTCIQAVPLGYFYKPTFSNMGNSGAKPQIVTTNFKPDKAQAHQGPLPMSNGFEALGDLSMLD